MDTLNDAWSAHVNELCKTGRALFLRAPSESNILLPCDAGARRIVLHLRYTAKTVGKALSVCTAFKDFLKHKLLEQENGFAVVLPLQIDTSAGGFALHFQVDLCLMSLPTPPRSSCKRHRPD